MDGSDNQSYLGGLWNNWRDTYKKWTGVSGRMGVQDWQHDELTHKREATRDTLFGKQFTGTYVGSAHIRPDTGKRPVYERYADAKPAEAPADAVSIPIGSGSA